MSWRRRAGKDDLRCLDDVWCNNDEQDTGIIFQVVEIGAVELLARL